MEESKFLVDIIFGVLGSVLMTFFYFGLRMLIKHKKNTEGKYKRELLDRL